MSHPSSTNKMNKFPKQDVQTSRQKTKREGRKIQKENIARDRNVSKTLSKGIDKTYISSTSYNTSKCL